MSSNCNFFFFAILLGLKLQLLAISVPLFISQIRPNDMAWQSHLLIYQTISYSLCVSLNLVFTILICTRIFMMRDKAEKVLGKLQACFYNSPITMFVESGGFFTLWSIVHLIAQQSNSWVQDVFLQPYPFVLVSSASLDRVFYFYC